MHTIIPAAHVLSLLVMTTQPPAAPAPPQARPAVDRGGEAHQSAYVNDRTVQYAPRGAAPTTATDADTFRLYEVQYPNDWEAQVARPHCDYCDHNHDGENAWDYHDHVLDRLPSRAQNTAGSVHWRVIHVQPVVTKDARVNTRINAAYAARLPARSGAAVRKLLATTLPNGTHIAEAVDTKFAFTAPLTRW